MVRELFLWPGTGRTAQAGQLDGLGWPAAVRQAGGRTGSLAAGLPPRGRMCVHGRRLPRVCELGVQVCGREAGGGGPPF